MWSGVLLQHYPTLHHRMSYAVDVENASVSTASDATLDDSVIFDDDLGDAIPMHTIGRPRSTWLGGDDMVWPSDTRSRAKFVMHRCAPYFRMALIITFLVLFVLLLPWLANVTPEETVMPHPVRNNGTISTEFPHTATMRTNTIH